MTTTLEELERRLTALEREVAALRQQAALQPGKNQRDMEKQYVEQRDEGYRVAGSRVSLDSVVLAFLQGPSPETIAAECFPTLMLEQVYGAITYYLAHRAEIDAYLKQADMDFESLRRATHEADPEFSERLATARRQMPMAR